MINGLHMCMCYQSVERKGRYNVHEHNDILISTPVKLFPAGSLPADIFLSDLFSCRPLPTRTYASPFFFTCWRFTCGSSGTFARRTFASLSVLCSFEIMTIIIHVVGIDIMSLQ